MKIERRGNTVFIAHNKLAIFFNRGKGGYVVRVNKGFEDDSWTTVGEMDVEPDQLRRLLEALGDLSR